MKTKHTPGPWYVDRWSDKQGCKGISVRTADKVYLANMVMSLGDNEVANARLIAAAPELLETCRALLHIIESLSIADQVSYMTEIERAQAIIARVE